MAAEDFRTWGVKGEKIRIVPYPIRPLASSLQQRVVAKEELPRFLFLGALCDRKGVDLLLRAFQELVSEFPETSLTIVGRDEQAGAAQKFVRDHELARVRILAAVPMHTIPTVIADCDVLVLPSRFDGWGMVLVEAASAGKAVIASSRCGAAYHVIRDGAGYTFESESVQGLVDCMRAYCRDPGSAREHGAHCRRLSEQLRPSVVASQMLDALDIHTT
jgi:glycosyltransferase involved in cell wall biosynthesis